MNWKYDGIWKSNMRCLTWATYWEMRVYDFKSCLSIHVMLPYCPKNTHCTCRIFCSPLTYHQTSHSFSPTGPPYPRSLSPPAQWTAAVSSAPRWRQTRTRPPSPAPWAGTGRGSSGSRPHSQTHSPRRNCPAGRDSWNIKQRLLRGRTHTPSSSIVWPKLCTNEWQCYKPVLGSQRYWYI